MSMSARTPGLRTSEHNESHAKGGQRSEVRGQRRRTVKQENRS